MALTVSAETRAGDSPMKSLFARTVEITGDDSYVTGGYAFDLDAEFVDGATLVCPPIVLSPSGKPQAKYLEWDNENSKFIFQDTAGDEVASEADASGYSFLVLLVGV